MGMKSKSGHFGSGSGGPSKRNGKFKLNIQQFAKMPKQKAQVKHIMASRTGHLVDTPKNRKILVDLTNDKSSFLGISKHGNEVYAKTVNGIQYWAYVRNGIVQDGGANIKSHRNFKEIIVKKGGRR